MCRLFFPLLFLSAVIMTGAAFRADGQGIAGPRLSAAGSSEPEKAKGGLRFVIKGKDVPGNGTTPYLMVTEKLFVPVPLQSSIPGDWVPIPKGRVVRIYDSSPLVSDKASAPSSARKAAKKTPTLLFSATLPNTASNRILGLVTVLEGGKLKIEFIDEAELTPGLVYFKNLTSKNLMLHFPDAPDSEKKSIEMPPGKEHRFGGSLDAAQTRSYKGSLLHQASIKNVGVRWIPLLNFSMVRYEKRAILTFLMEDPNTKMVIVNKIMIYCNL